MRGAQVKAAVGADPNGTLVRPKGDFFATGERAVHGLLSVERFPGDVWEPACGNGAISEILGSDAGLAAGITECFSTDLYDHGYGESGVDFLKNDLFGANHIITNPPFGKDMPEKFARRAIKLVPGKVALFARLAWLEGQRRHQSLWSKHPPSRIWVFPDRVPLARNGGEEQTGLIAFAWFVWDKSYNGPTELGWLPVVIPRRKRQYLF